MKACQRRFAGSAVLALFAVILAGPIAAEATPATTAPRALPDREALRDCALFLSGRARPGGDQRRNAIIAQPFYTHVATSLARSWKAYASGHLEPMRRWMHRALPRARRATVFYPFSGPDFPNAYAAYPEAETYLLIGLEPAGTLPSIEGMGDRNIARGMLFLHQLLETFTADNYFHTKEMALFNAWSPSIAGTSGLLLAFLGLMGFEPESIRPFVIDYNGEERTLSRDVPEHRDALDKGEHSVEIAFTVPETGARKRIVYLSADLSNMRAIDRNPGIFIYLERRMPEDVLIKAASYLLHLDNYRSMKRLIMRRARTIVMDDTGPRIAEFGPEWTITPYGEYRGTIELFANRTQPELTELYRARNPAKLPFAFGYGVGSRIMIITRR